MANLGNSCDITITDDSNNNDTIIDNEAYESFSDDDKSVNDLVNKCLNMRPKNST